MRYAKHILFSLLLLVLLTACGGNTGGTNTTAGTSTPKAAVTPPAITPVPQKSGTTKVTFWYGQGGSIGDVIQTIINKYNQSQDKYYVVGEFQSSYEDTLSKFNANVAGKDLPNVAQLYEQGTQRIIDTKKITPVQDLLTRDGLQDIINDLEPAIRDYYTVGGKLYSAPFNSSTAVMYYDKNAFKAAGLPTDKKNWTYDELLDAVKKLTKKDASGKVTYAGGSFYNYGWWFEQAIAIHNQLYASPDNGRVQRATKYVFNNPAGMKWLELQKQMVDAGAHFYPANGSGPATDEFLNGNSGFTFGSIASLRGNLTTISKNGNKIDLGAAYLPRQENAGGRNVIGGASLWITNTGTSAQQAGAWDFVKFTLQKDTGAYLSANTGYVPVRVSAYDEPAMKDALAKYPQFMAAVEQLRSAPTSYPSAGGITGTMLPTRNLVQTAIEDYMAGRIATAQAALDGAAKKANDQLEEYNAGLK
jgi:sn-glycerol 3-phosphate transport system substrate-binding protein